MRIGDADRVRLGAHLAEGTTVMHEGFVNYNAGTLGDLDGRGPDLRAASWSTTDSDVGGGASIMGTLSGGGTEVDLGRQALPDRRQRRPRASRSATTASSRPAATSPPAPRSPSPTSDGKPQVVKALELSGADNVLFRRNSVTGTVEAVPWRSDGVALNAALHAN